MPKSVLTILLALVLLTGAWPLTADAAAESADRAEPMETVNVTEYVLSSAPETAGAPTRQRPETPKAEHVKLFEYSQNIVLKGMFEKNSFFFQIAPYWDVRYAYAQIEYTVSPLIQDVPASLTFFINDSPIYSCAVDYADGAAQVTYVSIPISLLKTGFNEFALTGFVRLYDEEGCLDDFSGANWISVSRLSFLEVGYDLVDIGERLSYYPYPLLSTMDETGAQLTVYVPENALEEELAAAFLLRADLGNETSTEDQIGFHTLKHYGEDGTNALVVATLDRLPASLRSAVPNVALDNAEGAFVYRLEENGSQVFVVTAWQPGDLMEGAQMLADDDRVSQERYSWAYIPSGSADKVIQARSLSALIDNGETIKGITDRDGIDFIGPFHQESTLYLPFSGGFVLGEGGKIDLRFRYSDNLDFDRSLLTVYWGDTPVASKKLTREHASGDSFSFLLPSDVVGTHASSIRIAFDLEIKELYCTKRADEMPWAYVSGSSTLYLPVGGGSTLDLALRPYPFQLLGQFNALALVVPDRMTDTEYALFGRLAALLGTNVSAYGSVQVWRASEYPAETANCNIVTLGTAQDNALLRKLNDSLSFAYNETGDVFVGNDQLLLGESYAREIGILQLIRSPWQEGRAVLAACGVDDAALAQIERFTAVQENTWTLAQDAFLIDGDLNTRSYRFLEDQPIRELTLRERIEENRDAVLFTIVSTAAMLILLIAVLLILVRYRRNRREEEDK